MKIQRKLIGLYGWIKSTPFGKCINRFTPKRPMYLIEVRSGLMWRGFFERKRWNKKMRK